ncbi:MAG: hypothetical protein KGL39_03545 [Patescibacteria group bacterium]|nr:hypothetical protein [Patescibacteria group bacterium]
MITQADLAEMNGGVARVHRLRGEYLRTHGTVTRRVLMRDIVELEVELRDRFGLKVDRWDLEEAPIGAA